MRVGVASVSASGGPIRVPEVLERFVALFETGAYWESHEVLEAAWRERRSDFYQGLILLASVYVHVGRRNAHGVRAQSRKALDRLEAYTPHYLGIDVHGLVVALHDAQRAVDVGAWPAAPAMSLAAERVRGVEPELGPLEPPSPQP